MSEGNMIFLNANVITLDPKNPRAEAVAVQNGKILSVGTNHNISRYKCKGTKVIDCKKRTVVPGLVDCHVHMLEFGFFLQQLDLRNTRSIEEMQQQLREHSAKNPELGWILGGRWDEEKFAEKRYPTRWDLDAAVRDTPVFLSRVCGHLSVANSRALRLAGVTEHCRVKGGEIGLDKATGQPNGILKDNARDLVWKVVPRPGREARENACALACEKAVESGLTGVHWLVSSAEEVQILQKMHLEGKLPLRVYLGVPVEVLDEIITLGLVTGFGNDMLKMGFIKILADGSLGARTAALKKPYSDDRKNRGMMLYTQKKLEQLISRAHAAGLQLGVHAIGDRAIENVLHAYQKALKKAPRRNHRHRIEHCSVLNPRLIRQMKRLSLTASIQPHFVISDFWTVDRVGPKRARWTYPFKTLAQEGVIIASGSDCPVELINPLLGIWAATDRKDCSKEKFTAEEALRTYSLNAAYASFDEDKKGTIETGKYADFTVLSDDVTRVALDKIRDVAIEMVMVNGKIVYSRE
jgi:predicted amidohydrolase YtcJ